MTLGVKIDCSPFYKKGFVCFKKSCLFYKEYKKCEVDVPFELPGVWSGRVVIYTCGYI